MVLFKEETLFGKTTSIYHVFLKHSEYVPIKTNVPRTQIYVLTKQALEI